MGTNTFNVTEFKTIYGMLEASSNQMSNLSNEIAKTCIDFSNLVHSEDSELSKLSTSYSTASEKIIDAKSRIVSLIKELEEEMKIYEAKTIANEQETSEKLKGINSRIEELASIFDGI